MNTPELTCPMSIVPVSMLHWPCKTLPSFYEPAITYNIFGNAFKASTHTFKYVLLKDFFIFSGMDLRIGNSQVTIGATGV